MGLKEFKNDNTIRQDKWNRPNTKSVKRLKRRIDDYEKMISASKNNIIPGSYHRPGSNNK